MAEPGLIVTWTWNKDDVANVTNSFLPEELAAANDIAPIIVLSQGDPVDVELARVEDLAVVIGADLQAPAVVTARDAFAAKVMEFEKTIAAKPDITAIFASFGVPGIYYVAGPDYIADVEYVRDLGLVLANDGAPVASVYREELSSEQALLYPSDVVYLDACGAMNSLESVQADPVYATHPAIAAGQVGIRARDYPATYTGIATFLEAMLAPLQTAEKVSLVAMRIRLSRASGGHGACSVLRITALGRKVRILLTRCMDRRVVLNHRCTSGILWQLHDALED